MSIPGTFIRIGLNSPRNSKGASGFMSNELLPILQLGPVSQVVQCGTRIDAEQVVQGRSQVVGVEGIGAIARAEALDRGGVLFLFLNLDGTNHDRFDTPLTGWMKKIGVGYQESVLVKKQQTGIAATVLDHILVFTGNNGEGVAPFAARTIGGKLEVDPRPTER